MTVSATSPRKMTALEFERAAMDLRVAGCTVRQIADKLGRSVGGTAGALKRAMARAEAETKDTAEAWRAMELTRLDRLHLAAWPAALKGNMGAIDRCIKIQERRAKLLGLDAATEHKLGVGAASDMSGVTVNVVIPDPRARET